MKIAIYLSAVPKKTKHDAKKAILARFAQGVIAAGDECVIVDDINTVLDADVAVIQGWIGMKSGSHLTVRSRVIEHQKKSGKHTLIIDSNLFGFLDPDNKDRYLRYSLDGIFPTTGYYFDRDIDYSRWPKIKSAYGFKEHAWKPGKTILICLQREHGWSMGDVGLQSWLDRILPEIRESSSRTIVLREHPGDVGRLAKLEINLDNWYKSTNPSIIQDFASARCTVTYNSSPGVASLLFGVPTIVTDPDPRNSQAYPWCMTDLSKVNKPDIFDRGPFYHLISQCHFDDQEVVSGLAWRFMRDRLP